MKLRKSGIKDADLILLMPRRNESAMILFSPGSSNRRSLARRSLALWLSRGKWFSTTQRTSKLTKWSLLNDEDVPEFPDSEWTNVLSGKAINLDVVFSGTLSTVTDNKTVETLGEFELLFGAAKPSKTVETHGDWVTAWGAASRAIKFAFPHRADELEAYREYITQYFAALHPKAHPAVFNLDRAIRKYVGSVRNCELHHVGQFRHFETRFLHSCGVGAGGTAPSNDVVGSKKNDFRINEPCHLWNSNACPQQASSCCYKHLCEVCGGKHRKPECKHDPGPA